MHVRSVHGHCDSLSSYLALLVLMALVACSSLEPTATMGLLPNPTLTPTTEWVLEAGTYHGQLMHLFADHPITLVIAPYGSVGSAHVSGASTCNHYSADWTRSDRTLTLEHFAAQARNCEPELIMVTDEAYLVAFGTITSIGDTGQDVLLLEGPDASLRFRRVDGGEASPT
jgi:heat shock protein HslJ